MPDRTAIVVVAGVGDETPGATAEIVAEGLARHAGYRRISEEVEWFPAADRPGGSAPAIRSVRRFSLRSPRGEEVDLYQYSWADLSRFPAALRSFVVAFLGLFLELPAVARTALLGGTAIGRGPVRVDAAEGAPETAGEGSAGGGSRRVAVRLLTVLEWLVAVPIMIVTFTLIALVGLVSLALALRAAGAENWVLRLALVAAGLVVVAIALRAALAYRRTGRRGAVAVTALVLGAAGVMAAVRFVRADRALDLALADTLCAGVAFAFRPLWLGALLVAALAALALAARIVRVWLLDRWDGPESGRAYRSSVTALLGLTAGPLGVAVLLAALSAGAGAASKPLTDRAEYTAAAREGVGVTAAERDAVLDSLDGVVPRPYPRSADVSTARQTPWCLGGASDWSPSARDCRPAYGRRDDRTLREDHAGRVLTGYEWGAFVFGQALAPLVTAGWLAAAILAILVLLWLAREIAIRPPPPLPWSAADRAARRVSWLLGRVDRVLGPALLVAVPAAAYLGATAWLPGPGTPGRETLQNASTTAALAGGAAAAVFLIARLLRLSPGAIAGGGTARELARNLLDRPYDIATYLREAGRGPRADRSRRDRMLTRYADLLVHVAGGGSRGPEASCDRLVLAAHSQGTVLTLTMLHQPPPGLPADVRLVTFGSPLRQLYRERLPRQFGWLDALALEPWRYIDRRSHLTEWVSLATPGDPLGRTVFAPAPVPWTTGTVQRRRGALPPLLVETTLAAGGHGAYWVHPVLYATLDRMVSGQAPPAG